MIKIKNNKNLRYKIEGDSQELDDIRCHFRYKNKNARFQSHSSPYKNAITTFGTFEWGMLDDVLNICNKLEIQYEIDEDVYNNQHIFINKKNCLFTPTNTNFKYRDYQKQSIEFFLKKGYGIIEMPTGSGKSLIIYGIINNLNISNVLLIVPTIQLVKQMKKDMINYGENSNNISQFSGFSKKYIKNKIVITNRQYLLKHIDEITDIDMIIVDEAHGLNPNSKITNQIKEWIKDKTKIRVGLTGSIPEDLETKYKMIGLLGPILISEEIINLQERDILADIRISAIQFQHKYPAIYMPCRTWTEEEFKTRHIAEYKWLDDIDICNKTMLKFAKQLKGNSLVLFDRIQHGNDLYDMLNYDKKYLIYGDTNLEYRENATKIMENEENVIILANCKCFGTGINIKNMNNILFTSGGKSLVKIIQGIGRGLRTHKNKEYLHLIDFSHNTKYSLNHFEDRQKLYKKYYDKEINNVKIINI